jgi:hypothetical protein
MRFNYHIIYVHNLIGIQNIYFSVLFDLTGPLGEKHLAALIIRHV